MVNKLLYKLWINFKFKNLKSYKSLQDKLEIFNEIQYWDRNKLEEYQLDLQNSLLYKTKSNSPYYKKKLKKIILPLNNIKDFDQIPDISKIDVQNNEYNIRIKKDLDTVKHTTSGSTGDPISIFVSEIAEICRMANFRRFLNWWGLEPYDKNVLIWGEKEQDKKIFKKIKKRFKNRYIKKTININVFELNNKSIVDYYKEIERFKPKFIRGYKSAILQFSELMVDKKLNFIRFGKRVYGGCS